MVYIWNTVYYVVKLYLYKGIIVSSSNGSGRSNRKNRVSGVEEKIVLVVVVV